METNNNYITTTGVTDGATARMEGGGKAARQSLLGRHELAFPKTDTEITETEETETTEPVNTEKMTAPVRSEWKGILSC